MTAMLLEAEHLFRYYGRHCAVNDVSFTLAKGQILGFLGPNGAGKTTSMQILTGNLAPSAGQIKINGIDLLKEPKAAKMNLGYLPDTPPLYKELNVLEFLSYCGQLHGISKAALPAAVKQALERCGLSEVSKRLIVNLSKGYQQRVGIAQAILHNPQVIILDEPTVGLDPLQIREIRALIRELGQDRGVILSTHILSEVQESCTHVQIIHQGQLVLHETIAGLNQQMQTGMLLVTTTLAADCQALLKVPGVIAVEVLSDRQLKIQHSTTDRAGERIAEYIISAGWGLQEMMPVKRSIEDIFITLTQPQQQNQL
ncbi:MAG: ATP-binding cassette domain-containing protein [Methylococcales bacterium]